MSKGQKIAIGVFIGIILLGIAIYLLTRKKRAANFNNGTPPPEPQGTTTMPATEIGTFPLQQGSKGALVTQLQKNINYVIYWANQFGKNTGNIAPLVEDGNWGPKTQAAFIYGCQSAGLAITSIATQQQYDQLAAGFRAVVNIWKTNG